ncbi:MAG: transglutaminase family protein [Rhodobacteraceae bacterium]|nr:transglutaminase family protein [Paracoccaceae bacterium]
MTKPKRDLTPEELLYLRPTHYIDSDSPEIRAFTDSALAGMDASASKTEIAIRLFDAVRDRLRYDPYSFALDAPAYRASVIANMDAAFCVPKAILLTACLRAAGIPAALGFADVKNHLNTPKLAELMDTDMFIYHGYVQLWLDGKTYKITPAFNMELCQRFGVKPLEFDGQHDALFHSFDQKGQQHMEYVNERGIFADPPIDEFLEAFRQTYPKLQQFNVDRIAGKGTVIDAFTTREQGSVT